MYVGWTDERKETAIKLWLDGLSASTIAQRLGGTTRNAVIGVMHRAKLTRTKKTTGTRYVPIGKSRKPSKPYKPREVPRPKRETFSHRDVVRDLPTEPLPAVDTMPAQVSFNGLEAHHCRAIVAEHLPFDANRKIYCGERKEPGKVYCACHVRRYENTIPATAATRAVVQGVYRAPGKNFGVGHTARVNEFLTETT